MKRDNISTVLYGKKKLLNKAFTLSLIPILLLMSNLSPLTDSDYSIPIQVLRNPEIYTMDADGSNLRNLTNLLSWDEHPSWSYDGTEIVFKSDMNGNDDIFVMEDDGSNIRMVTSSLFHDGDPHCSSDGRKIIFISDRDGADQYDVSSYEIYVMDIDGSNVKRLTYNSAYDGQPRWSPDGTKVAFTSSRDAKYMGDIYIMNADGGRQINLTQTKDVEDGDPSWSPDGRYIVFSSWRDGGPDIFRIDSNGGNLQRLTWNGGRYPIWSPDGTAIAFVTEWGKEIHLMNPDGGSVRRLNFPPSEAFNGLQSQSYEFADPTWAPDGQSIAFTLVIITYPRNEVEKEEEEAEQERGFCSGTSLLIFAALIAVLNLEHLKGKNIEY